MKKNLLLFFSSAVLLFSCKTGEDKELNLVQYVNPLVGTDFHGHTFPGAIVPFGMIQASPDTRLDGWDGCSGYHYSDSIVWGFTHTHLSGTGCLDYGDVLLMPFTGDISVDNASYSSSFSHENETVSPGYYAVLLDKYNIRAELTTSPRVALHRYTFPDGDAPRGVVLDLKHRDIVLESFLSYDSVNQTVWGVRNSRSWNENQKLSFSILFSQQPLQIDYYLDDVLTESVGEISGKNCKAILWFSDDIKEVVLKVALSANTSQPLTALKNHAEVSDFNFDAVKQQATDSWNSALGKITVEGKDAERKKIFYTALYHSFTAPYLFTDIDGSYLGQDGKIHQAEGEEIYTVFSLWDTYRALHPLLNLIDRKRTEDFLYTFMRHYEQGGMLPVWELAAYETWCMIGYHSVPVIYDAYVKGMINYDPDKMLAAMVYSAKLPKLGRSEYAQYGYIPADMEHEDISKTLEYAYDDWCIAQFAKATGNQAVYDEFIERSQFYKNILDANGFMHSKINGGFIEPFNPTEINNHFTEGNSWQYSTYVPHDMTTYIELIGGKSVAELHFDSLFHTTAKTSGRDQVDVTGLIGQYAHGNEPSHHAAYLYNYVGKPWKTQKMTRKIMDELYTSKPDGLCGNEDCGQMSAWYVFSAMGFYPVCPGDNKYLLGSPVFDKITMNLENGKQFVVVCKRQSPQNQYIQSAKLNGKTYSKSYITFDDIKDGGELVLVMGPKPNESWGSNPEDIPVNIVEDCQITMTPIISRAQQTFKEKATVSLGLYEPFQKGEDVSMVYPTETDVIYYTLDGSVPDLTSNIYKEPFTFTENAQLKAVSHHPQTGFSKIVEAEYIRYEKDKTINILSRCSKLYTAGGPDGLIDGVRGKSNFGLGGWQSYQGQDFEATVDLGSEKEISMIGAGFLQAVRSWIIFPVSVTFEISDDNITFKPYGKVINHHPYDNYDEITDDFIVKKKAKARYVRVKAENFGKLPEWHLGAGGDVHIFIDEILIQ